MKEIKKEFDQKFEEISKASRTAYMEKLRPGEPAPAEGEVIGIEYREEFDLVAANLKEEALKLIDGRLADIKKERATAPDQETVNALSMLKLISHPKQRDIDEAFEMYGGNYYAYKVLIGIAQDYGLKVNYGNELTNAEDFVNMFRRSICSNFKLFTRERGQAGFDATYDEMVDGSFPVE